MVRLASIWTTLRNKFKYIFLMVPRILHQTARSNDFSAFIGKCVSSLKCNNSSWDFRFYNDEDWNEVITRDSVFRWGDLFKYPTGIQRADIFRCAALYEQGGCYADVDMLGVRSLDSFIAASEDLGFIGKDTELIITIDHPVHSRKYFGREKIYMNNFMLAKPGARFLRLFLEEMKNAVATGPCISRLPVYTTGPIEITRLIHKYGGVDKLKIAVVPYFWVNPIPDMSINFPEKSLYAQMIRDGSWLTELAPYFVHCWWHSYEWRLSLIIRHCLIIFRLAAKKCMCIQSFHDVRSSENFVAELQVDLSTSYRKLFVH